MDLNEARKRLPQLRGLSDESAINVIHQVYYPTMDKAELAGRLGYTPPPPPAPERGTMRAIGDLGLQFGGGVASGLRMISDVAGADNVVSRGFRSAEEALQGLQSAAAQQDQQRVAEIMREAEGKGWGEQIKAGLQAFGTAPGAMVAQGLGTAVPTLAASLVPGGQVATLARLGAVGAAQGTGATKGAIYDEVKQRLIASGATPEEAEARATEAQSYGGANTGQIALGGALGAVAGSTGMERAAGLLRSGATTAPKGLMSRMLTGAATEAAPEFVQGGQEKYATNTALANEGFAVDPWAGVVAQGTLEGVTGGVLGAGFAAPRPRVADQIRATKLPEAGPMTRAVNANIEAEAKKAESAAPPPQLGFSPLAGTPVVFPDGSVALGSEQETAKRNTDNTQSNLATAAQSQEPRLAGDVANVLAEAKSRGLDFVPVLHPAGGGFMVVPRNWVTPDLVQQAERELDATIGRMQQAYDEPVQRAERRRTDAADLSINTDPVAGYVDQMRAVNTPAARAFVGEFDAGRIGRQDVERRMQAERGKTPDEILAEAAAQAPQPAGGLILNVEGKPFKTRIAANMAAKKSLGSVIEVPGGFAIQQETANAQTRPADATIGQTTDTPAPAALAAQQGAPEGMGVAQPDMPAAGTEQQGALNEQDVSPYEQAKAVRDAADSRVKAAKAVMDKYPKSAIGLTSDEAKATPQWRADRAEMDAAMRALQDANTIITKKFAKEYQAERKARRANEQDAPQGTARSQTQTQADQTPAAEGSGYAIEAAGIPAAGGDSGVRADGVGAYKLPDGRIGDDWTRYRAPDFKPNARQQALMDATTKALDSGKFYSNEVAAFVAKELGVSDDVLRQNKANVEGGDFGFDVYYARQAVEAKRANEGSKKIADELGLKAGDGLGTLVFNDFKVTTGVTVESVSEDGRSIALSGRRGPAKVTAQTQPESIKAAIERAHEKGKRKDSYGEFIAARNLPTPPAKTDTPAERVQKSAESEQVEKPKATRRKSDEVRNERWEAKTLAERERVAEAIGRKGIFAQKLAEKRWANIGPEVQAKLRAVLDAEATPKAEPQAAENPANPAGNAGNAQLQAEQAQPEANKLKTEYTRADVDAAKSQLAQMLSDRIEAMKAQEVQKIAARFLPAMGLKVPVGKAKIKAVVTDPANVSFAAADEFGVEMADAIRKPLMAEFEGRLVEQAQPTTQQPRFEAGKSLTKEQRKEVLNSLVDVYKAKGADREMKGMDSSGNERYGYVHSPDLFEKSDITGAMVRYYVTLPDGRKAHPTELFPDYKQSDIDAEMSARESRKRDRDDDVRRATNPAQVFATLDEANRWWNIASAKSPKTASGLPTVFPATERQPLTKDGKIILVPKTASGELLEAFSDAGWRKSQPTTQPVEQEPVQQAEPAEEVPAKPASKIEDLGEKIGGARKDTATSSGRIGRAKTKDERPAWARRFDVSQVVAGDKAGQWVIHDNKSKDWMGQPKQVGGRSNTYATEQEALDAIPLAAVSMKHRALSTGSKNDDGEYTYEIWRDINDRKRVKVVNQVFPSRVAALEYMAKHAQAILETNTTFGEADLPTPDRTDRTGAARRDGDVQGGDFMETFGLRGVEFGNWNNQIERQEVMNAAYDGLMDLAEVIGIPPKAIGLNGDLALAFGARGQGLNSAKAHYERARAVINLTKMKGAGALAHEWFHALDHYFGRQDGKASSQWRVGADGTKTFDVQGAESDMASGGFKRLNSGVRQELRDAYNNVMDTMFNKAEQYVEDTAKADRFVAASREDVAKRLDALRKELSEQKDARYYKRNNKPASAEQLAEFDTVAKQIMGGEALDVGLIKVEGGRSAMGARWSNDALEKLSAIHKAVRGRSGFDSDGSSGALDRLRQDMTRYSQRLKMLADAQAGDAKTRRVPTEFAMNAKELDQGRGENYWTTPHEMAARAFQGYVEDKIAAQGAQSPFLNYAPENIGIETPWGVKRPYPHGQERVAINEAFDQFVGVLKTKETEKGVAMFSRTPSAETTTRRDDTPKFGRPITADLLREMQTPIRRGIPVERVQSIVDGITAKWQNAPEVVVVESMSDENVPSQARETDARQTSQGASGRAEGFFFDNRAYIVAGVLKDDKDVARVLFHEVLGHYGLRGTFKGPELIKVLLQMAALRKKEIRAKARQYGLVQKGSDGKPLVDVRTATDAELDAAMSIEDRLTAAEEVLAEMAQTQPNIGFVQRAIAAIRGWLRKHVPVFQGMALTDAEIIANYILPARVFVERGPGGGPDGGVSFARTTGNVDGAMFSRTAEAEPRMFDVRGKTADTLAHYRGMALQALGRRQLVDLYADMLPQLNDYNELVQRMDADKNEAGAEADEMVRAWAKLDKASGRPGEEKRLADLMHDATLAQMDPAKDFVPGDNKEKYDELRARWDAISPQAKELYITARDMYMAHFDKVREALDEKIQRTAVSESIKAKMMARMEKELYGKLKGVYFPLARFGQYVVVTRKPDGSVASVSRAETLPEARAMQAEMIKAFPPKDGFTVSKIHKSAEYNATRDLADKGFMADLMEMLRDQGADDSMLDAVGQLYLSSLPDLSWAKHGLHRKGMPGFSQDARRAFAQNMFHGARYLAKLRYGDQLTQSLMDMQEHVKAYRDIDEYDEVKAQQVLDEMHKRHELLMNPPSHPVSTAMTSLGFVWFMGLSPASAMVNLSQTALMAYPIMGARWGFAKAGKALTEASALTVKAGNNLSKVLQGDELEAFNKAAADGTIDVTQAHDLAGIAQGEDQRVTWAMRPVMRAASFMFHHAEKFNRQATFLAAYRLAKASGADPQAAFEQAKKATYDGHFDYSAGNRPRLMQGNWQRVLFLFKQYGQNMVYSLTRNAYLSMKGMTPAERKEARKALSGILAMHAAAAGALGLPLVGPLLAAASFLGSDDDEPWDAEVAMRNAMADTLGKDAAEVIARGFSRLTPFDISGRVALNKLILPDVQEGLEGQRLADASAAAALGPVWGIASGAMKGVELMGDGHYMLGLEAMLPVMLKGLVKSVRFGTEGNVDKTGVVINDEVSATGIAGQALGLSPSEVRAATERRQAIYSVDRALLERRQNLMRFYTKAVMEQDQEMVSEAMKDIQAFNQKNPNRKITMPNLAQSLRNKRKRVSEAEAGVYLPVKRRDAIDMVEF